MVFDKAMNNFPPAKMPNGQWGMICRGPNSQARWFMLTGGVDSPLTWTRSPIITEATADGFRPRKSRIGGDAARRSVDRPFPRQQQITSLLPRVSADNGRTWTTPQKTNFPDATSKFFCMGTSRGYYVLVSNANPAGRNPLCLSTSDNGVTFMRLARLPIPMSCARENSSPGCEMDPRNPTRSNTRTLSSMKVNCSSPTCARSIRLRSSKCRSMKSSGCVMGGKLKPLGCPPAAFDGTGKAVPETGSISGISHA